MATLDTKIKDAIAQHGTLKIVLSMLLSALTFGKARGWFQKGNGPSL